MKNILVLFLLCVTVLWAVSEPWSVSQQGPVQVSWMGRQVISEISFTGHSDDYRIRRYIFAPDKAVAEDNVVRYEHKAEVADTRLSLQFSENTMTLSLEAMVQPEGPFEFSIWMPFENFVTAEGNCFLQVNRNAMEVGKSAFVSQLGCDSVVWDLPEARHSISLIKKDGYLRSFQVQDKRSQDNRVRCVGTFLTRGDKPVPLKAEITWTVTGFQGKDLAWRENFLKTPYVISTPMEVSNPGFEEGAAEWNMAEKSSIIEEKGYGKVLRFQVDDPKKDAVYVTRRIPVEGGAWYAASVEVRTENVMKKGGKMFSAGAGLIIEWADTKGSWMAGGNYACGRYGTSGWKRQYCENLRAPDNAGFAIVYLALRDGGTAYFDNFQMKRQEREVPKIAPEMGEPVATNLPSFQWVNYKSPSLSDKGISEYELQLSRNPDFPADATRSYKFKPAAEYQLPEPQEKGRWYWRVLALGMKDRHPWYFDQTANKDQDCRPPVITAHSRRVLKADDTGFIITVQDDHDQNPKIIVNDAKGMAYSLTTLAGDQYRVVPGKGWDDGLTALTITAEDKQGNKTAKQAWVLNAPKPERVVVIDKNGNYSENGRTIFPLGIYEVQEPDMDEVRQAGFEIIHTYDWEGSQDEAACKKYLDDCARHGLRAFLGFDRGHDSRNGMVQGNFSCIANRVGAQATNPGLFCWYLFDEPEIKSQYISPELMYRYAELVRELDPYHPVVLTTWGQNMNNYRHTWDTHWTQSYSKPAGVVKTLAQHRKLLLDASPITLLLHCYDQDQVYGIRAGQKPDFVNFQPDYDWMNACAFVGLAKEVNGLWWWFYAKNTKRYATAAQDPERWNDLSRVIGNVRGFRNICIAEGKTERGTVDFPKEGGNTPAVEWWVKHLADGKHAVIIVNTSEQPRKGSIEIPGVGKVDFDLQRYGVFAGLR